MVTAPPPPTPEPAPEAPAARLSWFIRERRRRIFSAMMSAIGITMNSSGAVDEHRLETRLL